MGSHRTQHQSKSPYLTSLFNSAILSMLILLTACDQINSSSEVTQVKNNNDIEQNSISNNKKIKPVFANQESVSYRQFIKEVEQVAIGLESSTTLHDEFLELQKTHHIANNEQTFKDFVKVRLAFEATRDAGLWHTRWAVTNQEPNSKQIWHQWQEIQPVKTTSTPLFSDSFNKPTATAECDELSALFSIIARDMGVGNVGLFWPTSNHTVAVWRTKNSQGKEVRVVIPTSQIYLSTQATLGTKEFNPYKQKNIYNYAGNDVHPDSQIPAPLAEFMIAQLKRYAHLSSSTLQVKRNTLSKQINGS